MHELLNNNYIRIIGSTLAVYLFIVIAIRLFGKKELAQLSVIDLVFILLISNAVQNAMVSGDNSLIGGLIAAGTLFVVNYILKFLQYRFPQFSRALQGDAIMLVYKGKVIESHMRLAKITTNELLEAIREHGVEDVAKVDLAILEVDGNISVISHELKKQSTRRRKAHKIISKQN
ncbi:MAG TPA: YetF domain-containing protein [Bacteroidales bacterium]|nr:YetF domain-containing protein [Bacteroidales bacterium]